MGDEVGSNWQVVGAHDERGAHEALQLATLPPIHPRPSEPSMN